MKWPRDVTEAEAIKALVAADPDDGGRRIEGTERVLQCSATCWLVAGDCNAPNVLRIPFRLELLQPIQNAMLAQAEKIP